jgi:phosphoribosylanthranilate isomerase
MRVKICGITNYDDAMAACEAGADALGFVVAPEARARKRYIDPEAAQRIAEKLPPFVSTVAVCVDEPPERWTEYLGFLDYVQLCGAESPEDCERFSGRVIKVFYPSAAFRYEDVLAYPGAACLLDSYRPGSHGGTGETCNWAAARLLAERGRPIILAGGLTPDNVAEAIRTVRPYAVDTSGGVEGVPGKKDHERIRRFISEARLPLS